MSKSDESSAARTVEHLSALARNQLTEDPPKRGAASLHEVQRVLERHRRVWRVRAWLWPSAAAGAFLAIASALLLLLPATRPPALMVEVLNGAVTNSGHVDGTPRGTTLSFSDGTLFALAERARARVASITAQGADLELERGRVSVHVTPRPDSQWTLHAGAHRVRVTGTVFDLEFNPEDQSLSLDLQRGSVSVNGPSIDGELRLSAGQHLEVGPSGGVRVSSRSAAGHSRIELLPTATSAPNDAVASPPSEEDSKPLDAPRAAKRSSSANDTWRQRVASGHFDEVISLAEQRGLPLVYERAELEELEALGDAARYVRRTDVAQAALLALRSRFASSRAARDAAFFLGRLEEDRGSASSAFDYYTLYLDDSPQGAYAAHALGRKLVIVVGARGPHEAQPIANEYLRRFPKGPHAAIARNVIENRSSLPRDGSK